MVRLDVESPVTAATRSAIPTSPSPLPGTSVREEPRPNRRYNSGRVHASHRPAVNLVEMGGCGVQHGDVSRWSENPSATTLRRPCVGGAIVSHLSNGEEKFS